MNFDIKLINKNITDKELLEDFKSVILHNKLSTISRVEYDILGKYNSSTLIRRFGSWNKLLSMLKIDLRHQYYSEIELLENIENCWLIKGKQPVRRDMDNNLISSMSSSSYLSRFGSWNNALMKFIDYINNKNEHVSTIYDGQILINKRTNRIPNNRLKVQVLIRDGNKCKLCGTECNDGLKNIHFDHIKPYSKGGETVLENLQILCSDCNFAKGNYYPEDN